MIVTCHDYYENGIGYVFTDCDNKIDALLIKDKDSGSIHDHFKNKEGDFVEYDWDWVKLQKLTNQYCSS